MTTNNPWECPRCGRINAPFNLHCDCKKDDGSILEKMLKDPKAQEQHPSISMHHPEHGWILTRCLNCGGSHGIFNGAAIQCINLQSGFCTGLGGEL